MPNLRSVRTRAYLRQHGLCCYCQCPMWLVDVEAFADHFGVSLRTARLFQCTAEHVVERQAGGANGIANILAACRTCNGLRHRFRPFQAPDADRYRDHVRSRVDAGRWHSAPAWPIVAARGLPSTRAVVSPPFGKLTSSGGTVRSQATSRSGRP